MKKRRKNISRRKPAQMLIRKFLDEPETYVEQFKVGSLVRQQGIGGQLFVVAAIDSPGKYTLVPLVPLYRNVAAEHLRSVEED